MDSTLCYKVDNDVDGTVNAVDFPIVDALGVTKTYRGGVLALDGVTLQVMAGEVYGLVGPNGAGKTTLMRVITGLITPTAGTVRVQDVSGSRAATVGSLIESPAFFPGMSGRENLRLLADYWGIERAAADHALDGVGLGIRDRRRSCRHYSLGMKQRLGVAAALLGNPDVVVLDEPTNGLDPESIVAMRDVVRRLGENGRAVLLSSHLLSEVELVAHRVGILAKGRLIAEDGVEELRRRLPARRWITLGVSNPGHAAAVVRSLGLAVAADAADVDADAADVAAGPRNGYRDGDGLRILLSGRVEAHEVNSALVAAGIQVHSLVQAQDSLETAVLDLLAGPKSADPASAEPTAPTSTGAAAVQSERNVS